MSISSITKGVQKRPPRILLYGTSGIGKSSWPLGAPNPVYINLEDRLAHIDCASFPVAKSYDEVVEQINSLIIEQHDYQTLVLDSLDWLEGLAQDKVAQSVGVATVADIGFGKGHAKVKYYLEKILDGLEKLREKKNTIIILIAHAKVKEFHDPINENFDQYQIALRDDVSETFIEAVDCVFFANYKVVTREGGDGETRGYGKGERVLYTQERPAFRAKNSYDMPLEIPYEKDKGWVVFASHYSAWLGKQQESLNKQTEENK